MTRRARSGAQGFGGEQTPIDPTRAGFSGLAHVWWAVSACDGQPAVHALSVEFPYGKHIQQHLQPLFRTYVTDVTARRHCTDLRFPSDSTFRGE